MATNHPSILDDQARLSEQPQLLNQLGYSHLYGDSQYGDNLENSWAPDHNAKIRALDAITVALTTGAPGETFAASFDDRGKGPTLVLAKNTPVTHEDEQAIYRLLKVITAFTTENACDVLPFLIPRCRENIEKRVMKMRQVVAVLSHDLEEILNDYNPSSIEGEFPNSVWYRQGRYSGSEPPFSKMMHNLLEDIESRARALALGDANLSAKLYASLAMIAFVLQESRLLRFLCGYTSRVHPLRKPLAEKLRRRLSKVCQYYHDINHLVGYAKQYFPDGIDHYWVVATAGTEEAAIELGESYFDAVSHALGHPLLAENVATLRESFPHMEERWHNNRIIKTRVHPELRIVLHLTTQFNRWDFPRQQPIGCSKRCCYCCTEWITRYNMKATTRWTMTRTEGKVDATWALPTHGHAFTRDGGFDMDEYVRREVRWSLACAMLSLFQDPKGTLDDEKMQAIRTSTQAATAKSTERALKDFFNRKKESKLTKFMKLFKGKKALCLD